MKRHSMLFPMVYALSAFSPVLCQSNEHGRFSKGHSYQYETTNERLSMRNMPLSSALLLATKSTDDRILVSEAAGQLISDSRKSVSVTASNLSTERLLRTILKDTGIIVESRDNSVRLILEMDRSSNVELTSLRTLLIEQTLRRSMPLHLDHVPAEMALKFIEGFAGVSIRCPGVDDRGFMSQPLVTIHSEDESLLEALDKVARQLDRVVKILEDEIVLSRKSDH